VLPVTARLVSRFGRQGRLLIELLSCHGVAARSKEDVRRQEKQTPRAQTIEEFAIVAHKQPNAAEGTKRVDDAPAGRRVEMIRRLVDGKKLRLPSECGRELGTLPLAMTQCRPARERVVLDAKNTPPSEGGRIARGEELSEQWRRFIRALRAVDSGRWDMDRSLAWLKIATRELQQRRLPRAVGAHNAGPPVGQAELQIIEEIAWPGVIAERNAMKRECGHMASFEAGTARGQP